MDRRHQNGLAHSKDPAAVAAGGSRSTASNDSSDNSSTCGYAGKDLEEEECIWVKNFTVFLLHL